MQRAPVLDEREGVTPRSRQRRLKSRRMQESARLNARLQNRAQITRDFSESAIRGNKHLEVLLSIVETVTGVSYSSPHGLSKRMP